MCKSKTYEERVKELREAGHIEVKDLKELLTFTLDKREDVDEDDYVLNFYIPVYFNIDKAFGVNVCTTDNDDFINVYLNYDLHTEKTWMYLCYCCAPAGGSDFELTVNMTEEQEEAVRTHFKKEFEREYGKTVQEWAAEE